MPLVRYRIGDRGILSPKRGTNGELVGQVLEGVLGRTIDFFVNHKGVLCNAGYLMLALYYKKWVLKYQVIQKSHSNIVFRIVKSNFDPEDDPEEAELEEIKKITSVLMDDECEVSFEFVNEIKPSESGKYRHILSEVYN
jgi:phenylacetate-CoA ligase